MNKYFFCQKTDKTLTNKIGQTYALNRYFAAVLFSIRKGIRLKDFLSIYSVYNFPTFTTPCNSVKITHSDDTGERNTVTYFFDQKTNIWRCAPIGRLERKCFLMFKPKYNYNKFIQFIGYIQKEKNYSIFFNDYVNYR